jgi:hypothetical protein
MSQQGTPSGQNNAAAANAAARALIVGRSVKMTQQIFSQSFDPAQQNVFNIAPRNVGMILGFLIEVNMVTADPGASNSTYNLTPMGPANLIQQITFNDLSNNVRVQTAGWHLHAVNSAKGNAPYGAARTNSSYPINYGANFATLIDAPSTYDHTHFGANFPINMMYWMPLAYSDLDLRGAIYANVVNATMQLQITLATNAQAFAAPAGDPNLAVYQAAAGDSGGAWATGNNCQINIYQVYYDQLPVAQNGAPILPVLDLSTIYEVKNTTLTGMTAGQDFPISYSNFRDFLATYALWDNQTGGTNTVLGSDVNYWALQSANFTNIFKVTPKYPMLWARRSIGDDFPAPLYYFPSRDKPISTVQYGNMALVLNPGPTVNTGARLLMGYEDFALVNTLVGAASLSTAA